MTIVHPNSYPKTPLQEEFEKAAEAAFPNYFNFNQSDLYRGDYQDDQTRHAFAGYQLKAQNTKE